MTEVVNSRWFHWYEWSWQHTIWWYSYIGIEIGLMECLLNWLTESHLLGHGYEIL